MPDPVINHQPTLLRLNWRRAETYLVGIPPSAPACLEHHLVTAPMPQIWRVRDPHMCTECCHRSMNQRPIASYSSGEKSSVLVFRWHDNAISLKAPEIFSQRKRNSWTAA